MDDRKQVEKIRAQYDAHTETDMEKLKRIDKKAKLPATIIAYIIGIVGALVLGTGMCFAMEVLGNGDTTKIIGIIVGIIGIAIVSVNYFIYRAILKASRMKYSAEIISLSDKMLGNENR